MGRFKVGAEVHDNDGFEGVIVGKPKKGWRDVAYQFGTVRVRKSELNFDRAGRAPKVCAEVCETEYKVGDRVRLIRDNTNGGPEYGAKGEEFEVTSLVGSGWTSDELRINHPDHGFDPAVSVRDIEPVVAPATTAEWVPKVGDRVRVKCEADVFAAGIEIGAVGVVGSVSGSTLHVDFELDGDTFPQFAFLHQLEPLPVAPQPAGFRVGGLGSYTTRDGRKALVEGEWGLTGSDYRWSGQIDGGEYGLLWKEDGTNYDGPDSPLDLIAEWVEPTTWAPVAGKFGKTRDGRKVGPMESGDFYEGRPFCGKVESSFEVSYLANGREWAAEDSSLDLIAEWPAPVAEAGATATPLFKKGDLLECVDGDHNHLTQGKVYEALGDAYGDFVQVKMDNGNTGGMYLTRFRLATPPAKFKVGDRVERKESWHAGMDVGDKATVTEVRADGAVRLSEFPGANPANTWHDDDNLALIPPLTIGTTVTLSARITRLTSDTASLSINGANVNLPVASLAA